MFSVKIVKPTIFNCCIIPLGHGHFAIVDKIHCSDLDTHFWYARKSYSKFYAVASVGPRGSRRLVYMHRLISEAGPDEVVHHCNHNSLDNRRCNLLNSINEVHRDFHHVRRWTHGTWQKTSKTRVVQRPKNSVLNMLSKSGENAVNTLSTFP